MVIIGKNITSHHWDYYRVLNAIYPGSRYYQHPYLQLLAYFTPSKLVLLDFEGHSFKFAPLVWLRSLVGLKTDIIAVSLANLVEIIPKGRRMRLHFWQKKFIFKALAKRKNVNIYYTNHHPALVEYHNHIYTDFQYWDLKYLRDEKSYNTFEHRFSGVDINQTLVFIGRFIPYRGSEFIKKMCSERKELPFRLFVWSGNVDEEFKEHLERRTDTIFIDETPTSDEIVNCHLFFKHHLLLYPFSKRTSGFFGRGIQCGNYLHVSPDFFTDFEHSYPRISRVGTIDQLISAFEENKTRPFSPNFTCHYPHEIKLC